ncbi:MAG: MBL fold metallo-hydrolase [Deferribacteraceae bacterium]|jgi:L-ascorbate metabolism protein UlaG (beta-lactamase superfamily)|nr:MBL fold metallo-hydrolase [Deferribacteraceae bacterium]
MLLLLLILIAVSIPITGCAKHPFDEDVWTKKVLSADASLLYADHTDENGLFFNPWMPREAGSGILKALSRRAVQRDNISDFPVDKYLAVENSYEYLSDNSRNRISFAGHASFIIQMDGSVIFTDPFFSGRALIVKKKVKTAFDFNKTPEKPVALISHNHYDHLDEYSVKELIKKDAVFIVPLKLKNFLIKLGAKRVYELDWWEEKVIDGIKYTFLPSQHWSRRLWQPAGATLWGGYLIEGSSSIYFSGDSGYFVGYKEFGKKFSIDYALLGVGAYLPRWFMHYAHQNVSEFFRAVDDLGAKTTIPMHLGVIQLGNEPVLYPLYEIDKFIDKNPEYRNRVTPLRVGEYIVRELYR